MPFEKKRQTFGQKPGQGNVLLEPHRVFLNPVSGAPPVTLTLKSSQSGPSASPRRPPVSATTPAPSRTPFLLLLLARPPSSRQPLRPSLEGVESFYRKVKYLSQTPPKPTSARLLLQIKHLHAVVGDKCPVCPFKCVPDNESASTGRKWIPKVIFSTVSNVGLVKSPAVSFLFFSFLL